MKERELAFAGAHSCSWYACRGGTHAVEQLRQRTEVVGSAPLAVGCGDDAGALRCVSTPAPCQLSARMCIRRGSFLQIIWTIWAELILQKEPAENCRLMLGRSRSRLC